MCVQSLINMNINDDDDWDEEETRFIIIGYRMSWDRGVSRESDGIVQRGMPFIVGSVWIPHSAHTWSNFFFSLCVYVNKIMHTKLKTSAARQERVVHALKIFYVAPGAGLRDLFELIHLK